VRYYQKEGLLQPKTLRINGRIFRDYTAENVQTLRSISVLRRLDFSVEEIRRMQQDPASIAAVVANHSHALQARAEAFQAAHHALQQVQQRTFTTINELAGCLSPAAPKTPPAESKPLFWQIDRQQSADPGEDFDAWQAAMLRRGTCIVWGLAVCSALFALLALFLSEFSLYTLAGTIFSLVISAALVLKINNARIYMGVWGGVMLLATAVAAARLHLEYAAVPWQLGTLLGIMVLYTAAMFYFLLYNKAVKEYFASGE